MCLVGEQLKKSTTCNIYRRGGCLCTPHWMWLHHEYSSTNSKPNITDILTPQSVTFAFLLQNMVVEDVGKSGTTSVSQTYLHPTLQGCNMLVQFVCCFFWGGALRFCPTWTGRFRYTLITQRTVSHCWSKPTRPWWSPPWFHQFCLLRRQHFSSDERHDADFCCCRRWRCYPKFRQTNLVDQNNQTQPRLPSLKLT